MKTLGDIPACGTIQLYAADFIRRFLINRIPARFHRIRHFGIFANGCRAKTIQAVPQNAWRVAAPGDTELSMLFQD
ncbi:MAG: transposase [Alphaproteobacteria bacterium]|nr:transposase [Alphaproteobacteria bacterium]